MWYEHFSNLLGKEPDISTKENEEIPALFHDLAINDGQLTMKVVEAVTKTFGKASGPDNIPPDVLKLCNFDDIILSLANRMLLNKVKPQQWSELDMITLPKSGDLSDSRNN